MLCQRLRRVRPPEKQRQFETSRNPYNARYRRVQRAQPRQRRAQSAWADSTGRVTPRCRGRRARRSPATWTITTRPVDGVIGPEVSPDVPHCRPLDRFDATEEPSRFGVAPQPHEARRSSRGISAAARRGLHSGRIGPCLHSSVGLLTVPGRQRPIASACRARRSEVQPFTMRLQTFVLLRFRISRARETEPAGATTPLFTCCGPWAMFACSAKTVG